MRNSLSNINIKNHIESQWSQEDDQHMNEMMINKCSEDEFLKEFGNKYTKKEIMFHIDVLHQIWTEQQEQMLIQCIQQLGNENQPDFNKIYQEIGSTLNKTKTQIKKHWMKIKNQLVTQQQLQKYIIDNYWIIYNQKLIDQNLQIKDTLLEQIAKQLQVPLETIKIQYNKYKNKILDFDKFYYSKDKKIIISWFDCNQQSQQTVQDLLTLLNNEYDVLEIYRFQLKNLQ